jgi:peptidoglycan hydrolase FlgJ
MNFAIAAAHSTCLAAATRTELLEHRKLLDAAQQFEGMLLQEMLKPMKEHGLTPQDGEDSGDEVAAAGGDTLGSYGVEAMATAIAKDGGLGIARRVVAQVEGEKLSRSQHSVQNNPLEFQNNTVTVLKSAPTAPMN